MALPRCRRSVVFQLPYTGIGFVVRYTPGEISCMSATTAPPPCHEVDLNHSAPWAASGGESLTSALTVRFGGPWTSVSVICAVTGEPLEIGSGYAIANSSPTPAATSGQRGIGASRSTGGESARPIAAPITPPHTAASSPKITPSGSSEEGHAIVIQTSDQPRSAARPNVPSPSPATNPNTTGRRVVTTSAAPSTTSASTT